MATMNISLPNQMRDWVGTRSEDGQYANNSDYIRDLIRRDRLRTEKLDALQSAITKGLNSGKPQQFDKNLFTSRMQKLS